MQHRGCSLLSLFSMLLRAAVRYAAGLQEGGKPAE